MRVDRAILRNFRVVLLLIGGLIALAPSTAFAACADPAGFRGEIIYNSDHRMMQFCDDTNWIAMSGQALPTCADGQSVQYSSGSGWGCGSGGGGGESLWLVGDDGIHYADGLVGIGTETPNTNLDIHGSISFSGALTPAALTADADDYEPSGLEQAAVLRMAANGPYAITGLAGGVDGRLLTIMNVGSTNGITLRHQDSGSAAENRFSLGGADVLLKVGQVMTLIYDANGVDRWRALSVPGGSASIPVCPIGDVLAYTANGWTCSSEVAPDVFDFVDSTGVELSKVTNSNIIQLTGLVGVQAISITGAGSPEYRTCSNSSCSTVITNWTSSAGTTSNNEYVQIRLTSAATGTTERVAELTVGAESADWSVTTTALTSVSFVASAGSTAGTITIPATAQTGDLAVLFDLATDTASCSSGTCSAPSITLVTPSGWTGIVNDNWGYSCTATCTTRAARMNISYRVLTAGQAGTSVTGMNDDINDKVMLVFRPNVAITNINATLWGLANSSSTPASQSLAASSVGGVQIAFGTTAKNGDTVNLTNSSPAFDGTVVNGDSDVIVGRKIYNSSPADHTIATTTSGSSSQRVFLGRGVIKIW